MFGVAKGSHQPNDSSMYLETYLRSSPIYFCWLKIKIHGELSGIKKHVSEVWRTCVSDILCAELDPKSGFGNQHVSIHFFIYRYSELPPVFFIQVMVFVHE